MKFRNTVIFLSGLILGSYCIGEYSGKLIKEKEKTIRELLEDKVFLSNWLEMKLNGKSFDYYIAEKGYKEVAIYGMGILGKRLLDELMNTNIHVKYAIDKKADAISDMIDIKKPSDKLERVDAIIVSSVPFYDEICAELGKKLKIPIVNIKDFLSPEYRGCS